MPLDFVLAVFLVCASSTILSVFSSVHFHITDHETEIIEQIDNEYTAMTPNETVYYEEL